MVHRKTHEESDRGDESALDDAIDTREVARLLGVSPTTIYQSRARGEGPAFFRVNGKRTVRYVRRDVLAYRDARKVGGK